MAGTTRRAVFTGIGVLSPIGQDSGSFWHSLIQGKSGIGPIQAFDPSGLPSRIAGEITQFDPRKYLDKEARKSLKVMARTIKLAVAASQLALDDAKVDKSKLDPTRFGVEFGSGLIATELDELGEAAILSANGRPGSVDLEKWAEKGLETIPPLWMLKYLPNMPACHVSIIHNAQGPNNSITESDVASLLAIGEAYRILVRDKADFFLVGGAESKINPLSLVRQCLFEPLSKRNQEPEKACRPFDKERDGIVIGEGAGVLVLEDLEHAQKRGARIYAELVGFGAAFDCERSGAGLARAIQAALKDAKLTPEQMDHVNAHGLAGLQADVWEAKALREVFGPFESMPPVFAAKSYMGNLGAAGGSVELAASLLAMKENLVPRTLNYDSPDPDCPVNVIAGSPRPVTGKYFLKVGFTPMGQCAALVCRKWE
jgi:3-oxoacyl-[acyl-carrier-protein] synthase II